MNSYATIQWIEPKFATYSSIYIIIHSETIIWHGNSKVILQKEQKQEKLILFMSDKRQFLFSCSQISTKYQQNTQLTYNRQMKIWIERNVCVFVCV